MDYSNRLEWQLSECSNATVGIAVELCLGPFSSNRASKLNARIELKAADAGQSDGHEPTSDVE